MKYYIKRDEYGYIRKRVRVAGFDYFGRQKTKLINYIVEADNKEEALTKYFRSENIDEFDYCLYSAVDKKRSDKNAKMLAEYGYSSWEEYNREMYPDRPIEL